MATAIDDRQELLEQFQAVSPVHSYKNGSFALSGGRRIFLAFPRKHTFAAAPAAAAARGFLSIARFYQRGNPPSWVEPAAARPTTRRVSPPCRRCHSAPLLRRSPVIGAASGSVSRDES